MACIGCSPTRISNHVLSVTVLYFMQSNHHHTSCVVCHHAFLCTCTFIFVMFVTFWLSSLVLVQSVFFLVESQHQHENNLRMFLHRLPQPHWTFFCLHLSNQKTLCLVTFFWEFRYQNSVLNYNGVGEMFFNSSNPPASWDGDPDMVQIT